MTRDSHGKATNVPKETSVNTISSPDGTKIAYEKRGRGPAVILVDGAMSTRSSGSKPELVSLLAEHMTVYSYDRRGRGDSGDTQPYAVEREIEDIETLIDDAGGTACLYGHSSGASLVLEAAVKLGSKVEKIALYEAPYNDDPAAQRAWRSDSRGIREALSAKSRADAGPPIIRTCGEPPPPLPPLPPNPHPPTT